MRRGPPTRRVVGEQDAFWVIDFTDWPNSYEYYQITATLKLIGQHCYIYVEDGVAIEPWLIYETEEELLQDVADTFDFKETPIEDWGDMGDWGDLGGKQVTTSGNIYNRDHDAFGTEWTPGIDGDERITILIYDIASPVDTECGELGIGGFFNDPDEYPADQAPPGEKSNEREMIYVNKLLCDMLDFLDPTMFYLLAHEFQHMIHWNYDPQEELWINEGIALQAAEVCGYTSDLDSMMSYAYGYDNSLTLWEDHGRCNVLEDYGAAFFFMEYIRDKYGGWDTTREIVQDPLHGIESIEHIVHTHGHPEQSFADVFDNWVAANHFDDPAMGEFYHYQAVDLMREYIDALNQLLDPEDPQFPVPFSTPDVQQHASYPVEPYTDSVGVWAANYAEFGGTPPGGDMTVYFTGDSRNVWSCHTVLTPATGTPTWGVLSLDPATQQGSQAFSGVASTYDKVTLVIANHADYGRPPGTSPRDLAQYTYQTIGPPPEGDVDGDGSVDVADLALFRDAFGGTFGAGGAEACGVYDPKCDLDGDDDVDWDDFWRMWYNNPPYHEGWLPGDVTGAAVKPECTPGYPSAPPDDYVDIWDLIAFAGQWNTNSESPSWAEVFDFADSNGLAPPGGPKPVPRDGQVNVFDLIQFAKAWHTGDGPAGSAAKGLVVAEESRPLLRLTGPSEGIIAVGDEVEVQVGADAPGGEGPGGALSAFDFRVTYDPSVLKLVAHEFEEGNALKSSGGEALLMEDLKVPGIAWFSGALAGADATRAPSASGRLATLRFRAVGEGSCPITLERGMVFDAGGDFMATDGARLVVSPIAFGGANWRMPIVLRAGSATDAEHYVGVVRGLREAVGSGASAERDGLPAQLRFELPNGMTAASAYLPADGAQTCRFTVGGQMADTEAVLTWPDLGQVPKDRVLVLRDLDAGVSAFVRTVPAYRFQLGAGGARHFELRIAPAQGVAGRLISGLTVQPLRGAAASIAFDLQADAAVSLDVMNVAGRRVRRVAAQQAMPAGRAALTWDGRSDAGTRVPSGTYVLRATASTPDGRRDSGIIVVTVGR